MTNMIKLLKRTDRILLEMHTGMLLYGIVCQVVGAFFAEDQGRYAGSLWFGILFAAVSSIHMANTLDRALDCGDAAAKIITRGYAVRYLAVACIFAIVAVTDVLNTLIVFLGYMSLKVTAYLQPLTHKFYNFILHESDPIPQALPDEGTPETEADSRGE